MAKIFIDVGHGGYDSGARGARSYEKDNVLKVALKMKSLLLQHGHVVKLSRETDIYLSLSQRAVMANNWESDIFISLHDNSAVNKDATGFETFVFDKTVNQKTLSIQKAIHNAIMKEIGIRDRGIKKANFAVLRETNMPAVLIEYAFISNYSDETLLINEAEKLAQLTVKGINDFYGIKTNPVGNQTTTPDDRPVSPAHATAWKWAKDKGLMNGERPGEPVTREQFATVLQRVYKDLGK